MGATSFVKALIIIGSSPQALSACLERALIPLLWTALNVSILWCSFWPVRWLGWRSLSWEGTVQISALFVLACCRWLLPITSSKVFFVVLALRNEALASEIKARRRVGLQTEMLQLSQMMVLGIVMLAALITLGSVFLPSVASIISALWLVAKSWKVVAMLIQLGWLMPLLKTVALIFIASLLLCGWGYHLAHPFIVIWRSVDPILALIAMVVVSLNFLHLATIRSLVSVAAVFYFSCTSLVEQLLVEYKHRLERRVWSEFKEKHKFKLLGFGLPIWLVVQNWPLLAVASLPIFQGAAASLLVDLDPER